MINEITIDIIRETGYTSWGDFLISIQQITHHGSAVYYYLNPKREFKNIELAISQAMIERLALEEGRIWLQMLKLNSFADLKKQIESQNRRNDILFSIDIIVRDSKERILIRKIILEMTLIERLIGIEQSAPSFPVYYEERKFG